MYYPLSQITTNLYTNGNEYVLANSNQPYIGYYWKNSKGQYFTGKTPQDPLVEPLAPVSNISPEPENNSDLSTTFTVPSRESEQYLIVSKTPYTSVQIPTYSPNIPTQQDYQIGEYRRYFCKKINEIIYLEISKDTYDKLFSSNNTIAFDSYQPFNVPWRLTGDKTQVFKVNKNIVELTMKQQRLPQFDIYLRKDYTKYYK